MCDIHKLGTRVHSARVVLAFEKDVAALLFLTGLLSILYTLLVNHYLQRLANEIPIMCLHRFRIA